MNLKIPKVYFITVVKKVFLLCYLLILVYWSTMSYSIFIKGFITPPFFVKGVIEQIKGILYHDIFLLDSDKMMLEHLSCLLLSYISISSTILFLTFLFLTFKSPKKNISEKGKENVTENESLHKGFNLFLFVWLIGLTMIWFFYTISLVNHLMKSKYGVESIVKNEASLNISKEQPLFINNEIQGITFDEAARVISIFYLKYIGLLYLEGMSLFAFIYMLKQRKEKLEIKT